VNRIRNKDSLWWRDLKRIRRLEEWENEFNDNGTWNLGTGKNVRFWKDKWLERFELRKEFPRLYGLSLNKYNTLNQVGEWSGVSWRWKLNWRRNLLVWESDQVNQLLSLLVNKEVVKEDIDFEKVDNWIWREGESRRYTVKFAYIISRREFQGEDCLIIEQFWKIKFISSA